MSTDAVNASLISCSTPKRVSSNKKTQLSTGQAYSPLLALVASQLSAPRSLSGPPNK